MSLAVIEAKTWQRVFVSAAGQGSLDLLPFEPAFGVRQPVARAVGFHRAFVSTIERGRAAGRGFTVVVQQQRHVADGENFGMSGQAQSGLPLDMRCPRLPGSDHFGSGR